MAGDVVWMDVLPSMGGFARNLITGTTKAASDAGKQSGHAWSGAFAGAAGDAGTQAVVDELETAKKRTEKVVGEQTQAIAKARAAQGDAAAKVVLAEQALADARAKNGDGSAKAEAAELRLKAARDRLEAASTKTTAVEDQLVAAKREHREVTQQLETATEQLSAEAEQQTTAWGSVKTSLGNAKRSFDDATGGLGGLIAQAALAVGAAQVLGDAWSQALDLEVGTDKVAASLDLTASQSEAAGAVAGSLYSEAYGDSLGEVSSAVGSVMSSISGMRDASQADLEAVTANALDFAKAFDVDVSEAARNAGILIETGLATDATHAFDLMTASLQRVPEALRGEVTDATQEYSQYFATLGLSGEQAMGLLVDASANGQYAIDKTGDALKELTIRSSDMSKASVDAYEAAGLSAEDMAARFLAGGDDASSALSDLVSGLQGIKDPTDRANAAIALFGTPLEDIGTDKIPQFLDSLSGVGGGLGDVSGKASDMGDTLNGNVATGLESLKRGFMDVVSDGLEPLLGPASAALAWMQENPAALQVFAVGLGALAAAWGVYTVALWAANSAMLASPVTWIVAGIVAVGAAVWAAVANWDAVVAWIKDIWEPVGAWFAGVWEGFLGAVEPVISWFQETVAPVFAAVWDGIKTAARIAWDVVRVIFVTWLTAWTLLAQGFMKVWDVLFAPVWEAVKRGFRAGWAWVDRWVFTPMKAGWRLLADGFASVWSNVLSPTWEGIKSGFRAAWKWVNQWVFAPMKAGWDAVGEGFGWVKDNLIDPAWSGVKTVLKSGWDWISDKVFGPIKTGVDAVGQAFRDTKDLISRAWDKVKEAAAKPVNFIIETVYTNGIKKTWDSIADKVGLDLKLPTISPLRFAAGGVLPGYTPGRDVHSFYSPTGGRLELSGGEAIMRPEWTRAVGGPDAVARMNAAASTGQAFAGGGVWGNITGWAGDVWDSAVSGAKRAWDWAGDAAAAVGRFLKDPVGAMMDLVTRPVNALLEKIGAGKVGELVAELPRMAVDGLIDTVKGLVTTKNEQAGTDPLGAGGTTGMSSAAIGAMVRQLDPTAVMTSGYRPGAITATGVPSFHGMPPAGRAADFVSPNMGRTFDILRAAVGMTAKELFYSGRAFLRNGVAGPMRDDHWDHVHLAMASGGVLPSFPEPVDYAFMDSGGWIEPGFTVVENRTGRRELVLNPDQIDATFGGGRPNVNRSWTFHNYERPVTPAVVVQAERELELHDPNR